MKFDIEGIHITITPSLRTYVEMKLGQLSRFISRFERSGELMIFVELGRATKHHRHGDIFFAKASIKLPGHSIRAKAQNEDVRVAIDIVRDTLKRDIAQHKEKVISKTRSVRMRKERRQSK